MTITLSGPKAALVRNYLEHDLDRWVEAAKSKQEVDGRSSLSADDRPLPGHPIRDISWSGLVSSVDHLSALRDVLLAARTSRPYADLTLLRSALLSAARTIHLLDDSPGVGRAERRQRGALALYTELRDEKRFLGRAEGESRQEAELLLEVDVRLKAAERAALDLGMTAGALRRGLTDTCTIETAARVVARDGGADPAILRATILGMWSHSSGAAHGRFWPYTGYSSAHDGRVRAIALDVEGTVAILAGVMAVLNQAWRLWDLRRQAHVAQGSV